MGSNLGIARMMSSGWPELAFPGYYALRLERCFVLICDKLHSNLPAPIKLDINLGQQFRIKQCAMLGSVAAVDTIARAQGIE